MRKLTSGGVDWGKLAPSEELTQAVEEVYQVAQKIGMTLDDVRKVFADMADKGLTDVPMSTLALKEAIAEIPPDKKGGPQAST